MDPGTQFLGPTNHVGRVPEQNVSYKLQGVDVVLHAKLQLCRSNGAAPYGEQTHTQSPLLHRLGNKKINFQHYKNLFLLNKNSLTTL